MLKKTRRFQLLSHQLSESVETQAEILSGSIREGSMGNIAISLIFGSPNSWAFLTSSSDPTPGHNSKEWLLDTTRSRDPRMDHFSLGSLDPLDPLDPLDAAVLLHFHAFQRQRVPNRKRVTKGNIEDVFQKTTNKCPPEISIFGTSKKQYLHS